MRRYALHLLIGLLLLARPAQAQDAPAPEDASGWRQPAVVEAQRFMIVTANGLATEAGAAALRRGGSAVDAMVAAQLMLNLVEPQSSGIGGGAFLLHWDAATRTLSALDGRETAPMAVTPELFLKPDGTPMAFDEALPGGRSVGVPGTLALLELAHRLHGRLPWSELVQPVAELAEKGFEISPRLAGAVAENAAGFAPFPATRAYFLDPQGQPRQAGSVLRNPDFAATLRQIAAEGSAPFYRGRLGDALVAAVRTSPVNPGAMTAEDLAGYRVKLREPVCRPYRTVEVCGMGPPSSGGVAVLQILGLVEHFDLAGLGPGVDGFQALLEASKLAFADRNLYLADPDHVRVPVRGLLDRRLPDRPRPADPAGQLDREGGGRQPALARGRAPGAGRRREAARHQPPRDRRRRRQRPVDDHHDRERVRQPAHGRRLPAQQRADRLLLPAGRRRPPDRQPGRARQAAAQLDGADDRVRPRGRAAACSWARRAAARSSATSPRRWSACSTGA